MFETTSDTKLFGIIGTPIEHTLSPKMHSIMASVYGVDMVYLAFDVPDGKLAEAMAGVRALGAGGFNITSPYKIEVMRYIDEIDEEAKRMGSVNTIVNRDGRWFGYNTDGAGFVGSLLLDGYQVKDRDILLLGAGGSARSVAYRFAKEGARSITFSARTPDKVKVIQQILESYTDTQCIIEPDWSREYDIIVNTTPLGMHPLEDKLPPCPLESITPRTVCCDLIYNPAKTLFLQEAEKRGAAISNGLGMLILQGIYAFTHFTGVQPQQADIYKHLMRAFQEFQL